MPTYALGVKCPRESNQPLTVFAKHRVRRDKQEIFANWCREINALVRNFEGYISTEVIRPTCLESSSSSLESEENISIFRYDNYANLEAWMKSKERQSMLDRVQEFSDDVSTYSYHSLEHWFPSDAVTPKRKGGHPPPKYKMWAVTMLIIYSQTLWVPKMTMKIAPNLDPNMLGFIHTFIIVTLSTYMFFPIVTRLLAFWLVPSANYIEKVLELVPSIFKSRGQRQEAATDGSERTVTKGTTVVDTKKEKNKPDELQV